MRLIGTGVRCSFTAVLGMNSMNVEVIVLLSDDEDTAVQNSQHQADVIDLCSPAKSPKKREASRIVHALPDDEFCGSLVSPSEVIQHPKRPRSSPEGTGSVHVQPQLEPQLEAPENANFSVPSGWAPVSPEVVGGKLYSDRRSTYVRHLAASAKKLRGYAEDKKTYETTIRAMVTIALCKQAIRTPDACHGLDGIAHKLMDTLRECPADGAAYEPPTGKYASAAVAALLAMAEFEAGGGQLCTCEELVERTNAKIDVKDCRIAAAPSDYASPMVMDIGFSQIKKLIAGLNGQKPFLKERKSKKLCASGVVFELTEEGRIAAKEVLRSAAARLGPLRELMGPAEPALVGAMLAVDFREAGGGRHQLHDLANLLSAHRIPFVIRSLGVADFAMFVSAPPSAGGSSAASPPLMAPLLIERKTYEDVALSMADSRCSSATRCCTPHPKAARARWVRSSYSSAAWYRWERQQQKMLLAKSCLGASARLMYLIEGSLNSKVVHGGSVGHAGLASAVQVGLPLAIPRPPTSTALGALPTGASSALHLHALDLRAS